MSDQDTTIKTRVLLVDDEQAITDSLSVNLEACGRYEVHSTNDPLKALKAAQDFGPDVIVLDVVMPVMDGGDVQNAIRNDPKLKHTPIILCTALVSNTEVGEGAREGGGDYILAKPVRLQVLSKLIDQLASGSASPMA